MITIKKKSAGSYYVEECPAIEIYKSEETGHWITVGKGYEDASQTKRDAVTYAEWIYNFTK